MKKFIALIFALVLCIALALPVFAQNATLLIDDANLLTSSEEAELSSYLQNKSASAKADIVVLTVDSIGALSPEKFAQDYYIDNDYGYGEDYDGVLLLISMANRDVYVLTCGKAEEKVNESSVRKTITSDLSAGKYFSAFKTFADEIEDEMTAPPVSFVWIPLSLAIGFVVALIISSSMKSSMKSVRFQSNAASYVRNNSLEINQSQDRFLYMHIDRVPKPKQQSSGSTRSGGSGHSFGGSGGKF